MNERTLLLLYRSVDEELSRTEQEELLNALASSPELREEQKRLHQMRRLVQSQAVRSFKPFFSARVVHHIQAASQEVEDFWAALVWSFRLVAVSAGTLLVMLLANNLLEAKSLSIDSILALPQPTLEQTWALDTLEEGS
ncbi:MAG: hypothetical protein ACE5IY_09730 [bacterium]